MTYAPGKLSQALASVNASGAIRIAWVRATPSNVAEVLRSHGTPRHFDALNVDVDGDELPLIEAILAAGFSPAVVALTINPDVPPPLQLRTSIKYAAAAAAAAEPSSTSDAVSRRPSSRHLHGAEEPCDTFPCSNSYLSRLRAAGLGGSSADAAFHAMHAAGYSLLGFGFGRFSSWCLKCEHRMWWVRSDALARLGSRRLDGRVPGGRAAAEDAAAAYRRMVYSFWAHTYAAFESPHNFPGKLLAHSSGWSQWRKIFDESIGQSVAARAWGDALLGRSHSEGTAEGAPPAPPWFEPNTTLKGWCLKADPCPVHAVTHAPPSRLPSPMRALLNCTLPPLRPKLQPETPWLKGSFHLFGAYRHARFAIVSEHLASDSVGPRSGACAFGSEWVRSARAKACGEGAAGGAGGACGELALEMSVTQLLGGRAGGAPALAAAGGPEGHQELIRTVKCEL